jgi:chemotaxis protein histidine kinase CheA|tara:strand:- start:252 stop:506 length:255 start_codon:yes stop_codon:yes gene_type:complete
MNTNGIGLGLVISKNITEAFGGDIEFNSQYGKGSSFKFTFNISSKIDNSIIQKITDKSLYHANSTHLYYEWKPSRKSTTSVISR